MSLFDYERAKSAVADDAFGRAFLDRWVSRLEALTPLELMNILTLIRDGKEREGWAVFRNEDTESSELGALVEASRRDVRNTAQVAEQAELIRQAIQDVSRFAVAVLLKILSHGFL